MGPVNTFITDTKRTKQEVMMAQAKTAASAGLSDIKNFIFDQVNWVRDICNTYPTWRLNVNTACHKCQHVCGEVNRVKSPLTESVSTHFTECVSIRIPCTRSDSTQSAL